jgi:hypothetical protein
MDDDFVDDDLCKERDGQAHELHCKRGEQHVAPDVTMLKHKQLGNEPAQPELSGTQLDAIRIRGFLRLGVE